MLRTHAQDSYTVLEHSLLTAENIRIAYPKEEWFQVTGLIHSLGKLLRHTVLGDEPKVSDVLRPDPQTPTPGRFLCS
jgi:hypothetical protein